MRVRNVKKQGEKIGLQMTPMIDIVFQLLVFFIMTFTIVASEGDFHIKMPNGPPAPGDLPPKQLPPYKVVLPADNSGELTSIRIGENVWSAGDWGKLRGFIMGVGRDNGGPNSLKEELEIELDCAYNLRYEHVIDAITAVSGHIDSEGNVVTLVEKIRLSPAKREPGT